MNRVKNHISGVTCLGPHQCMYNTLNSYKTGELIINFFNHFKGLLAAAIVYATKVFQQPLNIKVPNICSLLFVFTDQRMRKLLLEVLTTP